jgi:predicted metal-dependent HD superfamily phosphohydrolase
MTPLERWRGLGQRLRAKGDAQAAFARLSAGYAEPGRAYHTLAHIEACLTQFDQARHLGGNPDRVEFALWYHDVVYDSRRLDNEEASACVAARAAAEIGLGADFAARVGELILATKHEVMPADIDAQLVVDCDLASLGCSPEEFDRNGAAVRRECGWMSEGEFRRQRDQLFERFLSRPNIYCTEFFRSRYEAQARENLERVWQSRNG